MCFSSLSFFLSSPPLPWSLSYQAASSLPPSFCQNAVENDDFTKKKSKSQGTVVWLDKKGKFKLVLYLCDYTPYFQIQPCLVT